MVRSSPLLAHLSRVQGASHADVRTVLPALPHERTLSRWYRELGDRLVIFPTFALAPLGLGDVHVFLATADESWLRFPYAVDHAWVTQDFTCRVLYLHCIVPLAHQDVVVQFLRDFVADATVVRTSEGVQDLPVLGTSTPMLLAAPSHSDVLHECPLVIPVIFEGWNRRTSLPQLWKSVDTRLGSQLREYAPRRHRQPISPVTAAYATLTEAGLFRQHTIHYAALSDDAVEVLAVLTNVALLEPLRSYARTIEEYVGTSVVVRLVGTSRLMEALLALPAGTARLYFVHKHDQHHVRFCYEMLFVPKTGTWVFSREHLKQHLWGNP